MLILDIGCGDGSKTVELEREYPEATILGVDVFLTNQEPPLIEQFLMNVTRAIPIRASAMTFVEGFPPRIDPEQRFIDYAHVDTGVETTDVAVRNLLELRAKRYD